jgi:hypothetical protein
MAIVAQAGILGFGPQAGKEIDVPDGEWFRHKATLGDLAVLDDQRLGPPEVGGRPLPTIPYKAGVMVGGGLTIHPRLEASIGYLLKGAFGFCDTTSGSGGVFNHIFKLDPSNPGLVPWMGFRKAIPTSGDVGDYVLGEIYKDCKIINLGLTLPNMGLVAARVDAIGRLFELEQSPDWYTTSGSTGGWNAAGGDFEDFPSIPIGSTPGGYITTPDFGNLPVVQAQFTMNNQNLDIRQEKVYGSPFLEDVTIVTRGLQVALTVKWKNPGLYRQILTGSLTGTEWSSVPFTTPITFRTLSPANMPGEDQPYEIIFTGTEVMLALQGGITLAGNDAVLMNFTGNALDVAGEYCTLELRNQWPDYDWPSP